MRESLRPWACALVLACATQAHASVRSLAANGAWFNFNVDDQAADSAGVEWIDADNTLDPGYGSALSFAFSIDPGFVGRLTVLDTGFSGDRFSVFDHGTLLGATSLVPAQTIDSATLVLDPDTALADAAFSRRSFTLGAGSHLLSGSLLQSVLLSDGLTPLNATAGALRLEVSAVPEPSSLALLAAGALSLGAITARRRRKD
jgi:hypothetical protein